MKYVLHLKHWQLFLITFVLPVAFYIVLFISMFVTMMSQVNDPEPNLDLPWVMFIIIPVFLILIIASMVTMLGWSFQVATGLYKKLPPDHTMKIKRYYFAFFYPMAYIILIFIVCGIFFLVTYNGIITESNISPAAFSWFFLVIPFHFLAMACMFYTLYFNAKSLKSVELQRNATPSEYIAEFVMMWFFFIGVFFIQPRINQIFSEETATVQ